MVKLVGKVKTFSINTRRVCKQCGKIVKRESTGRIRCPNCGILHWTQCGRIWFGIASLDIFDTDVRAFFMERVISKLLSRIGVSWQMYMDQLKGLRGLAWFEQLKRMKKEIEAEAEERLVGQVIVVYGKLDEDKSLFVKKIGTTTRPSVGKKGIRFVEGKLEELLEITRSLLPRYKKDVEFWEDTPVVRFVRVLHGIEIEIGIRAPLKEYGKSYRIWMRVNGAHMYPDEPVRIGKDKLAWVLRVYHTRGWKEKLEKILRHCVSLEDQAVKIFEAAKTMDVKDASDVLPKVLSSEEKEEILEMWNEGSLWDLVEAASKVNRDAGVYVLKKYGFLKKTK